MMSCLEWQPVARTGENSMKSFSLGPKKESRRGKELQNIRENRETEDVIHLESKAHAKAQRAPLRDPALNFTYRRSP